MTCHPAAFCCVIALVSCGGQPEPTGAVPAAAASETPLLADAAIVADAREGSWRRLWEAHRDEARRWAGDHARLTRSHVGPDYHPGLSVIAWQGRPTVLRYAFPLGTDLPLGWDPATATGLLYRDEDVVVAYHLADRSWSLVWPNALWREHAAAAASWGHNKVLSRSHYGPFFGEGAVDYRDGRPVRLNYCFARGLVAAQKGSGGDVVSYDLVDGTFSSPQVRASIPVPDPPDLDLAAVLAREDGLWPVEDVAVADLDGDGDNDILVVGRDRRSLGIFLGDGRGTWRKLQQLATGQEITGLVAGTGYAILAVSRPAAHPASRSWTLRTLYRPPRSDRFLLAEERDLCPLHSKIDRIGLFAVRVDAAGRRWTAIGQQCRRCEVYCRLPDAAGRVDLDPPCPLAGECVFADLDGDGNLEVVVSDNIGRRFCAIKPHLIGTLHYARNTSPTRFTPTRFTGTRYPEGPPNLCVVTGERGEAVLSLADEIRRFRPGLGWERVGGIPGFCRLAKGNLETPYQPQQVILVEREGRYQLVVIDLPTLAETMIGSFPPIPGSPLEVILPRDDSPQGALLLYRQDQVLISIGLASDTPAPRVKPIAPSAHAQPVRRTP